MKEFIKKLFEELQEELAIYNDLGTLPVRRVVGALHSISGALDKLKMLIAEQVFMLKEDEIQFFKYDKPAFVAEQFYVMEIFTIETTRPSNDITALRTFYELELKYIKRFFEQHKFLYTYYQFDMKDLDNLLFIRGAKPTDIPVPETIGLDPAFSSTCDLLFGKFIAFERVQTFLLQEIAGIDNPQTQVIGSRQVLTDLKWTGEAINLMEIAMGILLTGQVNDGNASITEIVRWLELSLQVKIGRPNKRWNEISSRTRNSPTKFLQRMQDAIRQHIDEELDISRDKRNARRTI